MGKFLADRNYTWLRYSMAFCGAFVGTLGYRLYENRWTISWQWMVGSIAVGLVAIGVMLIAGKQQGRLSLDAARQNLYRD